jgi:hypothetical protein
MSVSLERLARNQILFREVNERLHELSTGGGESSEYVCECSNVDCVETISLTREEYESVRSYPAVFVVTPGHEIHEVERIVAEDDGYTLVEKIVGVEAAVRHDPRSDRPEAA